MSALTQQPRHFLDLSAMSAGDLRAILDDAGERKALGRAGPKPLDGRVLAMIFEKPSTRTRVSFDVAMRQLGGETLFLSGSEMQLGRAETIADTARVLSRYVDAIMIRTTEHARLLEMAEARPCRSSTLDRRHASLPDHGRSPHLRGASRAGEGPDLRLDRRRQQRPQFADRGGGRLRLLAAHRHPEGSDPDPRYVERARAAGTRLHLTRDAEEAVSGADCVVTDTWVSMGREAEARVTTSSCPIRSTRH